MRFLMYTFRVMQYFTALLAICAIVSIFYQSVFNILWVIVSVFLYFGWKHEADDIKNELEI